jgi:hypothetical protein
MSILPVFCLPSICLLAAADAYIINHIKQAVQQGNLGMLHSLKTLPAAQTMGTTLLADLIQQALLHGDDRMVHVLCGLPSAQQIRAARMQQLLGEVHTLDCLFGRMVIEEMLKLPGALAMVRDTLVAGVDVAKGPVQHAANICCPTSLSKEAVQFLSMIGSWAGKLDFAGRAPSGSECDATANNHVML